MSGGPGAGDCTVLLAQVAGDSNINNCLILVSKSCMASSMAARTAGGILNGASRFCVVGMGRLQGWLEPMVCMHSVAGVAVVPVWRQG